MPICFIATSFGIRKTSMSIGADILSSEPVDQLCRMFANEFTRESAGHTSVPSMLNALGACAGFAA